MTHMEDIVEYLHHAAQKCVRAGRWPISLQTPIMSCLQATITHHSTHPFLSLSHPPPPLSTGVPTVKHLQNMYCFISEESAALLHHCDYKIIKSLLLILIGLIKTFDL